KPVGAYLDASVHRQPVELAAVPAQSGWLREAAAFTPFEPKFSGQRATLQEFFSRGKQRVALNVAFYRAQSQGDEMVNSANVIVGANDSSWRMLKHGATTTPWGAQRVKMESAPRNAARTSLAVRRV